MYKEPIDERPEYDAALADFDFERIASSFAGSLESGINVCIECCDRHAGSGGVALDWEGVDGRRASMSFIELKAQSARFANLLSAQGIGPGDVVAGLLPRTPALLIVALGTWRAGAVYQPLFTAFGGKAIEHRVSVSGAKLIVTDAANRYKLSEIDNLPTVVVSGLADSGTSAPDIDLSAELDRQSDAFEPVLRSGEDPFIILFTSGTTGLPKGVQVPIRALCAFLVYMRDGMDLRAADNFWNIADPGWAYGLYYAILGPLLLGHATTFYEGSFTAESTYRIIAEHGITNLAGSPTAFRLLIAAGPEAAAAAKGRLRVVSSAGEPLNPEVIRWFAEHLDVVVHDQYGQTETGMVLGNHHGLAHPVSPGSAGFAMPGYRVTVLGDDGGELPAGTPGALAIDIARSPLMWFTGYFSQPTAALSGGYYRTGDTVEIDANGEVSFIGRADDVITSSGYRIGPFDVESSLLEHDAVIEAAVVGKPDPHRTELVKAFVVVASHRVPDESLAEELKAWVKHRLSAHAYPREIEFVTDLPKTPSGKLQRFLLRNQELAKAREQSDRC
jgi:acetyl-CoA synthetase